MDREEFQSGKIAWASEAQTPLWFWNDKLKKEELRRQLELMSEKGVVCNSPHARSGFIGDYLDEEWFDHISTVADYKKEKGETFWIYDEFNWPAGMAGGKVTMHEEYREKYLWFEKHFVPAGTKYRLHPVSLIKRKKSPEDASKQTDQVKIDNIFCFDAQTMEALDVKQFQPLENPRRLFSLSETDFEVVRDRDTIIYEVTVRMDPFCEEGQSDPDYLNPDATQKFIDVTFEEYYKRFPEAFGSVITADFNDETRFAHPFVWTDRLPDLFEEGYGYRLEEHLPDLILPGEEYGRTKCHYFELLADLYQQNYHAKLNRWCRDHHIDYCPHLLGEECMAGQARFGGDLMRQVRETGRPGADHLGKGIGSLNLRFISSAAELFGKDGMVCETFAACGWEMTFEEYLRMCTWAYSQGVRTIVNHGFFYSTEGFRHDDWPPSQFFQWQGWDKMQEGNAFCRRMYAMTENCPRQTGLLIYHPIESFWRDYIPNQYFTHGYHMGPYIQGERAAAIDRQEQVLLNRMQEENRDFTVFSSSAADLFTAEKGELVQKNTGLRYKAFVLGFCDVLPVETARLLDRFTEQGGLLAVAEHIPAMGMRPEEDEEVRKIMAGILSRPNTLRFEDADPENILRWLDNVCPRLLTITEGMAKCRKNQLTYPDYLIDPYIHTGEDMTGVYYCTFRGEEIRHLFINYTKEPQTIRVKTGSCTDPEVWDAYTGEIVVPEILSHVGEEYEIYMTLPVGYGVFLVTTYNHESSQS